MPSECNHLLSRHVKGKKCGGQSTWRCGGAAGSSEGLPPSRWNMRECCHVAVSMLALPVQQCCIFLPACLYCPREHMRIFGENE